MLLGGVAATPTDAAVFTYSSTCKSFSFFGSCSAIGLADGDTVSGSITLADAALTPGGTLGTADLLDFDFTFGLVNVNFASTVGLRFAATLNAAMTGFDDFKLY